MSAVQWPDAVDEVIGGDLTAALAYVTPAGGAVVTAVAPVGLRDRGAGTVSFTTSFGFAKKLDRIRRDPQVALAFHAREHGFSGSPRYVLVQGMAAVRDHDERWLREGLNPQAARYLAPARAGRALPGPGARGPLLGLVAARVLRGPGSRRRAGGGAGELARRRVRGQAG